MVRRKNGSSLSLDTLKKIIPDIIYFLPEWQLMIKNICTKITIILLVFVCSNYSLLADDTNNSNSSNQHVPDAKNPILEGVTTPLDQLDDHIVQGCINNSPGMVFAFAYYLKSLKKGCDPVPSLHRLILVGPPGTGKTTLARAIGQFVNYKTIYTSVASFMGVYRNQTANRLNTFLHEQAKDNEPKIIIIDEMHKLFENYQNERNDSYETAAIFWLFIDKMERMYPNLVIIGTMNDASGLPPEIKSRFTGRIIPIKNVDQEEKITIFFRKIYSDSSMKLYDYPEDTINNYWRTFLPKIKNLSLREINLLVDNAKLLSFAHLSRGTNIVLTIDDIDAAYDGIISAQNISSESFLKRNKEILSRLHTLSSLVINTSTIVNMVTFSCKKLFTNLSSDNK